MPRITAALIMGCILASAPALAQKLSVTDRDCAQLVQHVASNDVNYKPGVDVNGRPVAPADLNPQVIVPPQSFTFDANIDLKKYGIPANSPLLLPSMNMGKIRVEDGGRQVYFNDQPLGNTEQAALAEACKQRQQPRR